MTTLYNRVDEGAYVRVKQAHLELDRAVAAAYGWPQAVAQDDAELVRRLFALNQRVAAGELAYDPFGAGEPAQLRL